MGRHAAPDLSHRRRGSGAGRAVLVAVAAIAVGVLFGAVLAQGPTVSGTFTGSQTAEPPPLAAPPTTGEPPTDDSGPLGIDAPSAPMRSESASGSADTTAPPTTAAPAPATEHFASCTEAKAAGVSMIPAADPRYAPELDHDGDGTACDRHGDPPTRYKPPPAAPCTCRR